MTRHVRFGGRPCTVFTAKSVHGGSFSSAEPYTAGNGPVNEITAVEAADYMWWRRRESAYSLRESAGPRASARPKRLKRATGAFLGGVSPRGLPKVRFSANSHDMEYKTPGHGYAPGARLMVEAEGIEPSSIPDSPQGATGLVAFQMSGARGQATGVAVPCRFNLYPSHTGYVPGCISRR